jgi:DnaK suppressor protein
MESKRYQALLEAEEEQLTRGLREREGIRIESEPDVIDEAQRNAERELVIHYLDRESLLLRDVRAALARIAEGTFGMCLRCDDEISPRRLAAVPWAPLCLKCQEWDDANRDGGSEPFSSRLEPAA